VTTADMANPAADPAIERLIGQIKFALTSVPGSWWVMDTVAMPVSPPALVIGPPRMSVRGYTYAGSGVTTVQCNIYAVVAMNQYSIDNLRQVATLVMTALERYTPGIVLGSVPGVYPSPSGPLPAYIVTFQSELH
jgi:hypothetical protein